MQQTRLSNPVPPDRPLLLLFPPARNPFSGFAPLHLLSLYLPSPEGARNQTRGISGGGEFHFYANSIATFHQSPDPSGSTNFLFGMKLSAEFYQFYDVLKMPPSFSWLQLEGSRNLLLMVVPNQ